MPSNDRSGAVRMCATGCGDPADPSGRSSVQFGPATFLLCAGCANAAMRAMRLGQAAVGRLRALGAALAAPPAPRPMLRPPPMTDPPIKIGRIEEGC